MASRAWRAISMFFPRTHDDRAYGGSGVGDVAVLRTGRCFVALSLDGHAEVVEPGCGTPPHVRRAFADAAGEHEDVETSEAGGHGGDRLAQPVRVHVEGELRGGAAFGRLGEDDAHVGRPGDSEQPGTSLERILERVRLDALMSQEPDDQSRVEIDPTGLPSQGLRVA